MGLSRQFKPATDIGSRNQKVDPDLQDVLDGLNQRVVPVEPASKPGRKPSGKIVVSLRLEPEVIAKWRATGPGWQARVNDALKRYAP